MSLKISCPLQFFKGTNPKGRRFMVIKGMMKDILNGGGDIMVTHQIFI